MAKILATVPLTVPASSIAVAVDATFTMSENYTLSGSGASPTVTLYWQYDQGSGTWIDIPTSGSTGLVASAGSEASAAETTIYSRIITCKSVGAYVIRAKGVSSTPTTVYSVNQPTTTVEVGDTVFESNTTENGYGLYAFAGVGNRQTFSPRTAHAIYKVRLKLTKTGSPTGDITVSILNECVSSPIAMSSITDGTYTFTFTTNPVLWAGAVYTMELVCSGGDTSNFIGIRIYDSASTDIYPRGAAVGQPIYCDWYFVECGDISYLSPPPGVAWEAQTMSSSANWWSVAYGDGVFVAVASGSAAAASSPDGVTWTARTLPSSAAWYSVVYGNGIFVAIATNGNAASSLDGITWTARTMPTADYWNSAAYGNGVFVAIAENSNVAATSSDGITWIARTLPSNDRWFSVAYGGGLFVVVTSGDTVAASSPDGITWTERTLPASAYWSSVAYGNGIFVAIAWNSDIAATSPDGITWTARTLSESAYWFSVTYGGGLFVAIAQDSTISASSPDGITWTTWTLPSLVSWTAVTYGNDMFLAVASGTTVAATAGWIGLPPPSICIAHSFPWIGRFQLTRVP